MSFMALPKRRADETDSIYKVETIPPPDGEDAYSAATKVGVLSSTQVAAMMRGTEEPPPQSGTQARRTKMTADPVELELDIADLELLSSPAPATPQSGAPVPSARPQPLAWAAMPVLMPMPMPAVAPQRAGSSDALLVVAMLIAGLALFALGVCMFPGVFSY